MFDPNLALNLPLQSGLSPFRKIIINDNNNNKSQECIFWKGYGRLGEIIVIRIRYKRKQNRERRNGFFKQDCADWEPMA